TVLEYLETIWREPDEGIWEVRGGRWHFTHSKVMAWVAFDRAAIIAETAGDTSASTRWRRIADEIHDDVCRSGSPPVASLAEIDTLSGALRCGILGTISASTETENTWQYQGGWWLGNQDSNHDARSQSP